MARARQRLDMSAASSMDLSPGDFALSFYTGPRAPFMALMEAHFLPLLLRFANVTDRHSDGTNHKEHKDHGTHNNLVNLMDVHGATSSEVKSAVLSIAFHLLRRDKTPCASKSGTNAVELSQVSLKLSLKLQTGRGEVGREARLGDGEVVGFSWHFAHTVPTVGAKLGEKHHCPSLGGLKPSPLGDGFSTRAAD
jgi:hypothetical protein